jgi:hypothetical protein
VISLPVVSSFLMNLLYLLYANFQGVTRLGREANSSRPSCAEIKNEWSCTSALIICILGVDRYKFTFTVNLH